MDSNKNTKDSEEFMKMASKYQVASDMTGDKEEDTKKLYKAVIGTDAADGLTVEDMMEAIA
jgi:hypothetical protein